MFARKILAWVGAGLYMTLTCGPVWANALFKVCDFKNENPVRVKFETATFSADPRKLLSSKEEFTVEEIGSAMSGNPPEYYAVVRDGKGRAYLVEAHFKAPLSEVDIALIITRNHEKFGRVNCRNPKDTTLEQRWLAWKANPENHAPFAVCTARGSAKVQLRPETIERLNKDLPKEARLKSDCSFDVLGKKAAPEKLADDRSEIGGTSDGEFVLKDCNGNIQYATAPDIMPITASGLLKLRFGCPKRSDFESGPSDDTPDVQPEKPANKGGRAI